MGTNNQPEADFTKFAEELSWDAVLSALTNPNRKVSVITAPNFEERSCALIDATCKHTLTENPNNRWHVVTFQGANEHDVRDLIKSRNCNRAYRTLREAGLVDGKDLFLQKLRLPILEHELKALLNSATARFDKEFTLIVDVSSIPRAFLWRLISQLSPRDIGHSGFWIPDSLYLVYSWATSYPEVLEYETTGQIVDLENNRSLSDIIDNSKSIGAVIFANGNVRNAFMEVEALLSSAHKKDFFVEIVHFVRPKGFSRSWSNIRRHQGLLAKRPSEHRTSNSYVYHVGHALDWMRQLAKKSYTKLKTTGEHVFVIAPNGPKIISILAQFVADEYLARIRQDKDLLRSLSSKGLSPGDCVAVLGPHGSQFLSVYSIGVDGEFSCANVRGIGR